MGAGPPSHSAEGCIKNEHAGFPVIGYRTGALPKLQPGLCSSDREMLVCLLPHQAQVRPGAEFRAAIRRVLVRQKQSSSIIERIVAQLKR